MRVVSGKYGSRPLKAVPGMNTRPTTDKIKESMFNLLGGKLDGGNVLDLYGGSGALAIEAISRGAEDAVICEKYRPALNTIQLNIEMTKEPDKFTILKGDNIKSIERYMQDKPLHMFDWVFIDPPYKQQKIEKDIQVLDRLNCLSPDTVIVCESDSQTQLNKEIGDWSSVKEKTYGLTTIRIYQRSV